MTGGAGFIGSHIVESLVRLGAEVIVYDNLSTGNKRNLTNVSNQIRFVEGDVLDFHELLEAAAGVDVISHQAASLEILRSIDDPANDLANNTIGTINVLRAAVKAGAKKVLNASSACIYGQAISIPEREDHPKNPNWPYGVSKFAAEKYCELYEQYSGIPVISLRYSIVYGTREWFGRVLTVFISRVLNDEPPVIFGNGEPIRDFVYVGDVAKMHNMCIENDEARGSYNVGTGVGTRIKELAELVCASTGKSLRPIFENVGEGELSQIVRGRKRLPSELRVMVLDVSKARTELGWQPKTELKDGLSEEIRWIRSNPSQWNTDQFARI